MNANKAYRKLNTLSPLVASPSDVGKSVGGALCEMVRVPSRVPWVQLLELLGNRLLPHETTGIGVWRLKKVVVDAIRNRFPPVVSICGRNGVPLCGNAALLPSANEAGLLDIIAAPDAMDVSHGGGMV